MSQFFEIHPENPQLRLISRAVDIIRKGGVIVYPTDSSYALACHVGDKQALDKIRRIRQLDDKHNFTLACKDLTQVSTFTKIKTIGIRIPDHPVAQLLLEELGEALFSTTLIMPGDKEAMTDPYDIRDRLEHELDLIIDAGVIDYEQTTIIEFSSNGTEIIRQGKGLAPMLD